MFFLAWCIERSVKQINVKFIQQSLSIKTVLILGSLFSTLYIAVVRLITPWEFMYPPWIISFSLFGDVNSLCRCVELAPVGCWFARGLMSVCAWISNQSLCSRVGHATAEDLLIDENRISLIFRGVEHWAPVAKIEWSRRLNREIHYKWEFCRQPPTEILD